MTIDEAQTMLNARAKCIEKVCRGIYEDCNKENCDNCDLCYAQGTNGEQKELMLQCVKWLEELKAIKDGSIPIIHGKAELELHDKEIRSKAIDDFVTACKGNTLCQTFGLRQCDIDKIAEQLKAGGNNDV